MAIDKNQTFYCEKCRKTMRADEFYGSNNLEKYPTGKLTQCKKCITMHVDNWNPKTFLWILQECDVPYIPDEWDKLMFTYAKDKSKVTGTTIMGRYLSKMKLKQWRDFTWKDTEALQEMADKRQKEAMERAGYDAVEIAQAIEDNHSLLPSGGQVEIPVYNDTVYEQDFWEEPVEIIDDDPVNDLTDEDKKYLRLKWGKTYKPDEWIYLENLYNNMYQSYDVQGAGHEDTLKFVCKTSLKANQLLDLGDVDGAQKMLKMYDGLMKSGKFTAVQNKEAEAGMFDSVGVLIEMCEKEGYIERYYIDRPRDKADFILNDMKKYTRDLVEGETNLSNILETVVLRNAREDAEAESSDEQELVTDEDFSDYSDFLDAEARKDYEV